MKVKDEVSYSYWRQIVAKCRLECPIGNCASVYKLNTMKCRALAMRLLRTIAFMIIYNKNSGSKRKHESESGLTILRHSISQPSRRAVGANYDCFRSKLAVLYRYGACCFMYLGYIFNFANFHMPCGHLWPNMAVIVHVRAKLIFLGLYYELRNCLCNGSLITGPILLTWFNFNPSMDK